MRKIKIIRNYKRGKSQEDLDHGIIVRNIPEPPPEIPFGFDVLSFEDLDNNQALRISPLERCIGILLVLKSKDESGYAGIIPGFHIPPYGKIPHLFREKYNDFIKEMEDKYEIEKIIVAGGKINNERNQELYQISVDNFFLALPDALTGNPECIQCLPLKNTTETWMQAIKGKIIMVQTGEEGDSFHEVNY